MTNKPNDTCIGVQRPAPVSTALTALLSIRWPKPGALTAPTVNLTSNLVDLNGRN